MKKLVATILPLLISSTVYASKPDLRCEAEIYAAAASETIQKNIDTTGVSILLEGINGVEGTERTYSVLIESTQPARDITRTDAYRVVLKTLDSCAIKSVKWLVD